MAIAPELTIGFVRPSALRSTAASELNGSPGAVDADAASRASSAPEPLADEREHERLGHAHDRELVLGVAGGVHRAAGADDADAEQVRRRLAPAPG